MGDKMTPISFEELIKKILIEYKETNTFMGVPVKRIKNNVPIGPAAGPHTQLAGNILAAYAAGASYFELKTVQILEGKELNINKPCIFVGHEVFNTEWSTELTVEEAQNEYIKAYLLIKLLYKELELEYDNNINFIISVGYDLAGIKSEKVDKFLENMKNAENTEEWIKDIKYIEDNITLFKNVTIDNIKEISPQISNTITLSTMHGCKPDEIEKIAIYLINEKRFNTFIKMNPTLAGKEKIIEILQAQGYTNIHFKDEIFNNDISLNEGVNMLKKVKAVAEKENLNFGIKLTNTFPVLIENSELEGEDMYMSGPSLYPISIYVATLLSEEFNGEIAISYSGGVDTSNISEILETGIEPVTVSSYLLKSGGYKNITALINKASLYEKKKSINIKKLKELADNAQNDARYHWKEAVNKKLNKKDYSLFCSLCNNCVDVCPNRANIKIKVENKSYVVHRDKICNECGCCLYSCIMGHIPYKDKFMIFEDSEEFFTYCKNGVLYTKEEKKYMNNGVIEEIPEEIQRIIDVGYEKGCF